MNAKESSAQIRAQVLRAIALNRYPGYHFCGNFLDMRLTGVKDGNALVEIENRPSVQEADGSLSPFALTVAADFVLANAIRSVSDPAARFATVSMHMQLTGAPLVGALSARGFFEGFFDHSVGKLGMSRAQVYAGERLVAFCTGSFMVLPAPGGRALSPVPWINNPAPVVEPPAPESFSDQERWIFERGEAAIYNAEQTSRGFLESFLDLDIKPVEGGVHATLQNGPHIGNRVSHVQGGISFGMALVAAAAALPSGWRAAGITASFVSPGEGAELRAISSVVHRGRMTAVVQTRILTGDGRIVLEVTTNHAKLQDK